VNSCVAISTNAFGTGEALQNLESRMEQLSRMLMDVGKAQLVGVGLCPMLVVFF
jgi:hypothetical protein